MLFFDFRGHATSTLLNWTINSITRDEKVRKMSDLYIYKDKKRHTDQEIQ